MKQIALALHNYHDRYDSFSPAYVADKDGKPMHSWRVLLLPWLGNQPLYDKYDFDEPWNGPNNSKLLYRMPLAYKCPTHLSPTQRVVRVGSSTTSYLAVVDPTTVWPGRAACSFADIVDGTSNTLLLAEVGSRRVTWLEPVDLEFNEALDLLAVRKLSSVGNHRFSEFFYIHYSGRNVALADGSIKFIQPGIDRSTWSAVLRRNDATRIGEVDLNRPGVVISRLRVDNCIRLAVFIILAFLPLPWVWLNPTSGT